MSEYLQLDTSNLQLSTRPTSITVEYDPLSSPSASIAEKRGRLENATLGIIVAADEVLRIHDAPACELENRTNSIIQGLVSEGMIEEPPRPSREKEYLKSGSLKRSAH